MTEPVVTEAEADAIGRARAAGATEVELSLDLGRTRVVVGLVPDGFMHAGARYALPPRLKPRTVYYWSGTDFEPLSDYAGALVKLVPTEWGPPTFEIDGIKMLPSARVSPLEDARAKVALVAPAGLRVLDTCGGLGYFAGCALEAGAAAVVSHEKSASVLWLRGHNPWSPGADGRLTLVRADVTDAVRGYADASFGAILHDPPRFGIAGELYSQAFYGELARVLSRRGRLFHYTGTPNRLTSGRDVPREVAARLERAGFTVRLALDGVLAVRR